MCSIFIFFLFPLVLSGSSYQPKELFNGQYECDFKKMTKIPHDIQLSTYQKNISFFCTHDDYKKNCSNGQSFHCCVDFKNNKGVCFKEPNNIEYYNGTKRMKAFSTTHEKIKCIGVSNNFIVTCNDAVLTIYRNDSFELQQFNINDLPDKNELINIMTIKGLVYCFPGSEETFYFCNNESGNDNDYYRIKITQKNKVVNNVTNSIDTIKGENHSLKKSNTKSKIFNVMAIFLGGVCFLLILNMIRLSLKSH